MLRWVLVQQETRNWHMIISSTIQIEETTSSIQHVFAFCPTYEQRTIDILPIDFYPTKGFTPELTFGEQEMTINYYSQSVYRVYVNVTKAMNINFKSFCIKVIARFTKLWIR